MPVFKFGMQESERRVWDGLKFHKTPFIIWDASLKSPVESSEFSGTFRSSEVSGTFTTFHIKPEYVDIQRDLSGHLVPSELWWGQHKIWTQGICLLKTQAENRSQFHCYKQGAVTACSAGELNEMMHVQRTLCELQKPQRLSWLQENCSSEKLNDVLGANTSSYILWTLPVRLLASFLWRKS